jgi:ABC-2 type transport system ATP-binding protein
MSIVVQNLTKIYGTQHAVDDLSFALDKNEIVAFLGPNGAGKSTTMKIATGYLPPSRGTVLIDGLDVKTNAVKVKETIGYLPENNPLYPDMYVHEYLRFSGRFFGLKGQGLKNRIARIIDMCQLGTEQNKQIGQLSKGYKQRVGLAQALLHDPSVLILDEPTSGLDPNQIAEVRALIKQISQEKTVLFSTHIMQEVQAICDRVIVINKGKLVADDLVTNLQNQSTTATIEVEFSSTINPELLEGIDGVKAVVAMGEGRVELTLSSGEDIRPRLMQFITDQGLPLIGMTLKKQSMEEVFASLTQAVDD